MVIFTLFIIAADIYMLGTSKLSVGFCIVRFLFTASLENLYYFMQFYIGGLVWVVIPNILLAIPKYQKYSPHILTWFPTGLAIMLVYFSSMLNLAFVVVSNIC